ncbi:MAG TPA: GrpB family protein [Chloroflexota bacterium]
MNKAEWDTTVAHPTRQDRVSTVEESQVRVVPYHADWLVLYENEAQRLRTTLSGIAVDVQHFGSTAVPGLDAKPNVDILVGVLAGASLSVEKLRQLAREWAATGARRT